MREKINRLARGIVDTDQPRLVFSKKKIEGYVTADEPNRFELGILSENGEMSKGLVYSDSRRIRVLKNAFGGERTKIACDVRAEGLSEGSLVMGNLQIVSNAGEFSIPCIFHVRMHAGSGLIRSFESAADFRRYFEEDENAAVRLFDYDEFRSAPFLQAGDGVLLYDTFRSCPDRRNALVQLLHTLGEEAHVPEENAGRALKEKNRVHSSSGSQKAESSAEKKQELLHLSKRELADPAIVEEAAGAFIRADRTDEAAFEVYASAIGFDLKITRLYEYYMYSLPEDFHGRLPREVYLYFAFENTIEENLKLPLYVNVLENLNPETDAELYDRYERSIQEYAIEKLLSGRINDRLAYLYDRMIYPDMIDARIASILPVMLNSCRISVNDTAIESVLVVYRALERSELYPLNGGTAYIPIIENDCFFLFRDAYGDLYADVPYSISRVMNRPELEERCSLVNPDQPLQCLKHVLSLLQKGIQNQAELRFLEDASGKLSLSQQEKRRVTETVLTYCTSHPELELTKEEQAFLDSADEKPLSEHFRCSLTETLIRAGLYQRAYQILTEYAADLDLPLLERLLLEKLAEPEQEEQDRQLLYFAECAFLKGSRTPEILTYLLRTYNGPSGEMYEILKRGNEVRGGLVHGPDKRNAKTETKSAPEEESTEVSKPKSRRASRAAIQNTRILDVLSQTGKGSDALISSMLGHPLAGEAEEERQEEKASHSIISIESVPTEDSDNVPVLKGTTFPGTKVPGEDAEYAPENQNALLLRKLEEAIYAMAERLLAQLLFEGSEEHLDEVYDLYRQYDQPDQTLERAYLTEKSIDYFIRLHPQRDEFFHALTEEIHRMGMLSHVPVIYLLAWTKHCSELEKIAERDLPILQEAVEVLLDKKLIFAYTGRLSRFIKLPEAVEDRTYIEYHGDRDRKPSLFVRVLPDEENFRVIEIDRVYQNIYVASLMLFRGEKLEYRIYPLESQSPAVSGSLSAPENRLEREDTCGILNEMSELSLAGEDQKLRDAMLRYVRNVVMIDEFFAEAENERRPGR